jgi:hypothetical protein
LDSSEAAAVNVKTEGEAEDSEEASLERDAAVGDDFMEVLEDGEVSIYSLIGDTDETSP